MTARPNPRQVRTPAGRLEEAQLQRVLGYQLAQATIVTDRIYMDKVGVPFELRPVEYTVLTLIAENPGGSLAQVARALAVTAPHISIMIDRLESRGLIKREQSESDRRTQVLHTTAKGTELVRKSTQLILDAEREVVGLTPGEQAMLVELLHKVALARGKAAAAG
ncbi:MAG: MarR family winged helix-turn-helix transcriptional regulator [Ramlibacter sp.]